MTAEEHNKTLSTLWFIYGAMHGLTLLVLLVLVIAVWVAALGVNQLSGIWIAIGALVFLVLLLAVGLLPLFLGQAFRKRKRSTRGIGMPLAVISLVNIPLGTALGIYTMKFLRSEGGVRLYGGDTVTTDDDALQQAMRGAQPLMNWAKKVKETE